MTDEAINPEVKRSLADLSGERVKARSDQDYPRHFWSANKNGHYRFALTGVAIAAPLSAAIGAAVSLAVGWALAPIVIPAFIAAGSLMAVEGFGMAGAAAASRASGLAEKHARVLDAETQGKSKLSALDDRLMVNGSGQHFEIPPTRDEGKLFSWKSGLAGAGMGAASGTVIGLGLGGVAAHTATAAAGIAAAGAHAPVLGAVAAAAAHVPLLGGAIGALATGLTGLGVAAAAAPVVATLAVAGAITFGLFGLTFGVERKIFKSIFDRTDAGIRGETQFTKGPDLGRAQSRESTSGLEQHRLRRQAEIEQLEKSYNDRISWGALSGRFRGFAGVLPGLALGAVVGALALSGVGLAAGAAAVAAHAVILPLFAAAGGILGMKVFSESGTEAGAEATARAIDTEFERNRALRAQGITPPAPREAKESWFSPKAGLIMGALGAVAGAAIAIAMAPELALMIPLHLSAMAVAGIGGIIGGGVGASYGLGNKTLKAIAKPFNWIYDKIFFEKRTHEPEQQTAPAQPQQQWQQAPAYEKVTADDMAKINERSAAAAGSKTFAQTIANQQASSANLPIGV